MFGKKAISPFTLFYPLIFGDGNPISDKSVWQNAKRNILCLLVLLVRPIYCERCWLDQSKKQHCKRRTKRCAAFFALISQIFAYKSINSTMFWAVIFHWQIVLYGWEGKNLFYYCIPLDYGPYVSTHRRPTFVYLPQLYFTITTEFLDWILFWPLLHFFAVRSRKQKSNKRYSFFKNKKFSFVFAQICWNKRTFIVFCLSWSLHFF